MPGASEKLEVRYEDSRYDGIVSGKGLDYGWEKYPNKRGICAFRVVKEYREPRECWAYLTHMLFDSLEKAEAFRAQVDAANPGHGYLDTPITHWREVV